MADVSKKVVANNNDAALRKNEVNELKQKLSKLETRLEAKKKEQDPVYEAIISGRDEKIKAVIKESREALAMRRDEIDRWKEANREVVRVMNQKENILQDYQKRLTNLSKTDEKYVKRISALHRSKTW